MELCGNRVVFRYRNREFGVKLSVGMRYIIELITHAGIPVSAVWLSSITASIAPMYIGMGTKDALVEHGLGSKDAFPVMPMTDAVCIRQVKSRLLEIVSQLAELEQNCDYARADDLRDEQEALCQYLKEVYRPDKRIRSFENEQEKQKQSVNKAIKRALQQVYEADAELGSKLSSCIKLGRILVYHPQDLDIRVCRL